MLRRDRCAILALLLSLAGCQKSHNETAAVDTTLPDQNVANSGDQADANVAADANTNALTSTSPDVVFAKPNLPTQIEQTQCHMGECSWERITAIDDLKVRGNEVLRRISSQTTTTETASDDEYPSSLPPGPHEWSTNTSFAICSLTRPTIMFRDASSGLYSVTPLHVVSPFGYETSAVATYKRVCHAIPVGSQADLHPDQLGYVDRQDDTDQHDVAQPLDVF